MAAPPRPRGWARPGPSQTKGHRGAASSSLRTVPGPEWVSPRWLPRLPLWASVPADHTRAEARPHLCWTGLGVTPGPGRPPQVRPTAAAWTSPASLALATRIVGPPGPSLSGAGWGYPAASWRPHSHLCFRVPHPPLPSLSPALSAPTRPAAMSPPSPGLPGICHPAQEGRARHPHPAPGPACPFPSYAMLRARTAHRFLLLPRVWWSGLSPSSGKV